MKVAKRILISILIILLMLTEISATIPDNTSRQITSTNQTIPDNISGQITSTNQTIPDNTSEQNTSTNQTIPESFNSTDVISIHQKIEETSANFALAPLNPEFLEYQNRTVNKNVPRYVEMTDDGYALGLIPHPVDLSHIGDIDATLTYEVHFNSYDLRMQGKVTPVKDQKSSGSCWAFATYASLESYMLPAETWDFSENNMKNLLSSSYPYDFDRKHNDGGNHFMSTAYLARWSGPVNESDDPYYPDNGDSPSGLTATKHVQDVLFVPDRDNFSDNDNIKWAIVNYGAVFSTMYIDKNNNYNSTNYAYYFDGSDSANHAIAIVGWDDSFDKNKFSTIPDGNGAFIIKNSWGTNWGEGGYFYISYYDSVIGSDNGIFTAEAPNNYDYVYQHDPLGWTSSFGCVGCDVMWAANIFTAESYESLEAVSFYTTDSNVEYELYIHINPDSGPINTTGPIGTKTGTIPLAGYHTIPLDSSISIDSGQDFSVVVKLTNPNYSYPIAIERPIPDYSSKATANTGESYHSFDGTTWIDITKTKANTNICIKAFTEYTPPNASGEIPLSGSIISNTTPLISVNITDNASGVNVSSIVMTVNGSIVEISNIPIAGGYKVYNHTVVPFADNQLINVSVSASDNASFSMTYNWSFTLDTDTTAPTSNTPSDIEFSANTTASFDKWVLTDLHPGYFRVLRNNKEIFSPTPWTNYTNITVTIDTNISLGDFNYTIQYNDTAGNNGKQDSVIITINDTAPPYASGESPANNSPVCDNTPLISVNITDNASGVYPASIVMRVNGSTVTPTIYSIPGGYNVANLTITPFLHTQIVNVTVNATDNNSNILNHSWLFTVDRDAPNVTNPDAIPATIESDGTDTINLSVSITDNFSGINSVSINLSTIGGSATASMTSSSGTYWIITNATGARNGTYYLPINATDNVGNSNTSVSITLFVNDTTPPILSDNMPQSFTNNTKPTISIKATDRGSGINTSSAEMKVESEQVLLLDTGSGFIFNFTHPTTAAYNHSETVNVTFNVADNEGHTNNKSWEFYIDNVAPTITITSPPNEYSTTASYVKVTGTVNGTGSSPSVAVKDVAVEPVNGIFSTTISLSTGVNLIYANVIDAAGNTNITHINVIRTESESNDDDDNDDNDDDDDGNGGGGGGGGGGTSGEDFYNIAETQTRRVSIFKDDNVSYLFEKTLNPVININFTAKVSASQVASKIEVLQNTSTLVARPAPGKVYKNINIWVGNYGWASEKNIKDVTISFTVPLDWITSNNIDRGSIALYRYNNDSWEQLPTSWTSKNENSITFTSSTQGFSPFAISGEPVSNPAVISTDDRTHVAVGTNDSNFTSSSQTNGIEPGPGNKEGTIMLWVLIIIIILVVTVIIFRKKDEIRRE